MFLFSPLQSCAHVSLEEIVSCDPCWAKTRPALNPVKMHFRTYRVCVCVCVFACVSVCVPEHRDVICAHTAHEQTTVVRVVRAKSKSFSNYGIILTVY